MIRKIDEWDQVMVDGNRVMEWFLLLVFAPKFVTMGVREEVTFIRGLLAGIKYIVSLKDGQGGILFKMPQIFPDFLRMGRQFFLM